MGKLLRLSDSAARRRQQHLRSCAEVLRLLAQRSSFDDEARDMVAFLVFNLRGIYATIEESDQVWEDRGYWKKAEALRARWRWSRHVSDELEGRIRAQQWEAIPPLLVQLIPHVQSITVTTITRNADWWCGALKALLQQPKQP